MNVTCFFFKNFKVNLFSLILNLFFKIKMFALVLNLFLITRKKMMINNESTIDKHQFIAFLTLFTLQNLDNKEVDSIQIKVFYEYVMKAFGLPLNNAGLSIKICSLEEFTTYIPHLLLILNYNCSINYNKKIMGNVNLRR